MKKELIKRIEALPAKDGKGRPFVDKKMVIGLIQTMDEPKQATLTDIIERIQGMEENLKALWLHKILKELGSGFEQKKFQEGFKLGSWIDRQLINADKNRQKLNKPVIPQFVADWYEKRKNNIDFEIWHYLHTFDSQKEDEFKKWMNKLGKKQIQTLINMHQFGYEVEKEKRYLVKAKSIGDHNNYLKYNTNKKHWYFGSRFIYVNNANTRIHHTHKELEEAGFGWVFDCEGIEIEEVE